MTRIPPPCSSSGRRGRALARLEGRVPHQALPFPPPRRPDTPSARHAPACRGTAASGAAQPRSAPFFNELHQLRRERRLRLASYDHARPFLLNDDLLAFLTLVGVRIIAPGVRTPALGPLQRGARGRFRYNQEGAQVDRRVPAGIVLAAPGDPRFPSASFQVLELGQRGLEAALVADDPGVALHDGLERGLHGKRILPVRVLEGRERGAHSPPALRCPNAPGAAPSPLCVHHVPPSNYCQIAHGPATGSLHAALPSKNVAA